MARPYDWSPLGQSSDPVPGNPETIAAESRQLGQTAAQLRAQIRMLSKIGNDSTLKGQYAGTIRAHAQQLSRDLGKVAARYEQVSAATGTWSGALDEAQRLSLTALHMAEGPHAQLQRLQAPQAPAGTATAAQTQQHAVDQQAYTRARASAEADLASAQRVLGQATGQRDAAGQQAARKITEASHDSLADGFWDQFKQAIGKIAGHLKFVAAALGALATIAAILAVVLTGPLALVFLLVAAGLLLTELGIHTVLAATGNGSWLDVGLDVFALATLGYGSFAEGATEALQEGAETVAKGVVEEGVKTEAAIAEKAFENFAARADELGIEAVGQTGRAAAEALGRDASELAANEIEAMTKETTPSLLGVLKDLVTAGSRTLANSIEAVQKIATSFPGNAVIKAALAGAKDFEVRNARVFLSGTFVDLADKGFSFIPQYAHLKDELTAALPADIGEPVTFYADDWTPTGFVIKAVQWGS